MIPFHHFRDHFLQGSLRFNGRKELSIVWWCCRRKGESFAKGWSVWEGLRGAKKKVRWTFERSSGPGRSNNTFLCVFSEVLECWKIIYYNICSITRWTPRTLQMSKYFCKNDWTCWSRGLDLLDMTWCTVRNCSAQPIFRNHMFKVQKVYNCKKTLYVSCCFVSPYIRLWKKHSVSMPDVILYTLLLCVLTLCAPWWKRWTTEDYDDAWSHRTFNSESLYFLIMGI